MKVEGYKIPKSSFLSVEKDSNTILTKMMNNKRLKKLIYHTDKTPLDGADLTEEETVGLLGKNFKIVPKLSVDPEVLNYIILNFDNFTPNATNTEFRDNIIEFDIICHFDQWQMEDMQLRPYRIAAEIDSMFDGKHLSGIGVLQFMGASQMILNDEFGGITLLYAAIHGEDDKKFMPNKEQEEMFLKDFNEMYNS